MSSQDASWMSQLSQRKLLATIGDGVRDNLSLHRWVLLKNLVAHADSATSTPPTPFVYHSSIEDEVFVFPDEDVFVFPDAASLVDRSASDAVSAEARWLDAVLEDLDDDGFDSHSNIATDDDDEALSVVECPSCVDLPSEALPQSSSDVSASPPRPQTLVPDSSPSARSPVSVSDDDSYSLEEERASFPYSHFDFSSDDLHAGVDEDSSDDESEGPITPLALSLDGRPSSSPLVYAEPDMYFVYPFEPDAISPSTAHSPLYFSEC